MGGLFAAQPLGELTAIELNVLYAMKGTKWHDLLDDGAFELDYLEVPLLLHYAPEVAPGFYGLGGAALNFILSCQATGPGSRSVPCTSDGLQPQTVMSGVFGVGFKKSAVGAEARIDFDLGPPLKTDNGATVQVKNRVVAIMIRIGR